MFINVCVKIFGPNRKKKKAMFVIKICAAYLTHTSFIFVIELLLSSNHVEFV